MAPSTRVDYTVWNDVGRVVEADAQRFTVASKHCKERVFEIPSADLDGAYPKVNFYGEREEGQRAAWQRLLAIQDEIVLALIGRDSPSPG